MFADQFYSFPSPAKLNLFLHIVGRRDDGYHELESIFQFLDFGDTIEIKVTDNNKIDLLTPVEGVENQDNLIVKAALLLQKNTRNTFGAQIKITKILPMGGGLGGGSSNAATVLLALNALWNTNLTNEKLAEIGLTLGADVPIFIHGFAAFAQGVGEKLTQVTPKEYWYLISKPNCSISTASVFTSVDLPRNTIKFPKNTNKNNINIDLCHNDCQTMVIKHYPKVANLLAWLVEYAPSRMTGTGACVFSRFDSAEEARRIQDKLPQGIESFVAKGSNQSQVINALNKAIKSHNG
ncbi:MAG: 4-(cytidine 5'-diphospho)-2-C-methyl-D-erythritol kinase [Alteromonadaceae bacterium]|nr:4-(cytidine 5'-diphospho)-2-C-methyl-D-erythritol kinase [Alteromonadaceae bacterium]